MRTPTGYEQFAAKNLTRPGGKGAWATSANSYCVEAVWFFGGFSRSFDNASLAANYVKLHHGLDPDYRTAVAGEFHYWGTGPGHITMHSAVHPGHELMASSFANSLAPGLGYMPITTYGVPVGHGHLYMGHSPYFGDQTLAAETNPSGSAGTVIGDDMTTYELVIEKGDTTGAVWFSVNRIQRWHVPNATSLADYIAFIAANGGATYDPKALPQVATIASFGAIVIDGTTASGGAGATVAQVQQISDASDAKLTAAVAKIPAAPTKFVAAP